MYRRTRLADNGSIYRDVYRTDLMELKMFCTAIMDDAEVEIIVFMSEAGRDVGIER